MSAPDEVVGEAPDVADPRDASSAARAGAMRTVYLAVLVVALAARGLVAAWGARLFPPIADGAFYHVIAGRVAEGHGYTWLWPDGAVTYAAHYPVGYPGALGLAYAIFGASPGVAMGLHAVVGALGALAAAELGRLSTRGARDERRAALSAGLLVALHPALVLYTPALMTEGVTGALLVIALALGARLADRARLLALASLGLVLGLATLVRPQNLALAPLVGALAAWSATRARAAPVELARPRRLRHVAVVATLTTALVLAVCAPWTVRNCQRMGRCALVSVNAGWNLLIGTDPAARGGWAPVRVPDACREVWDEAGKDECFGREGRRAIAAAPGAWLALAPSKLAATFDYSGAAPWYLHDSNGEAFGERHKLALGVAETVVVRASLLVTLVALGLSSRGLRSARRRALAVALALMGSLFCVLPHGFVAWLALGALVVTLAPSFERPFLPLVTAVVIGATALTHAVFFGGGRYSLVLVPTLSALAGAAAARLGAGGALRRAPDQPLF
jgi:hypothetical protein